MKVFNVIAKILAALAAVAGAVYVCATYGDKIVAWAKKLIARTNSCDAPAEEEPQEAEEQPTESAEEVETEETEATDETVQDAQAEEEAVTADEADFAAEE